MYTTFYGLKEKPFNIVPNPAYLFPSAKHRLAQIYLEYGLSSGNGFILLTGDVGTGKTTLIRQLMSQLEEDIEVAVIFNTNVSHQELLKLILQEFEIDPQGLDMSGLLNRLNDFLIQHFAGGRRVLLIIDEAQNLSREALEEVRMLSNLQSDTSSLLQIMLVGQPELRRKLGRPDMSQLVQRIGVRFHLGPLTRRETSDYIAHRLEKAGAANTGLFSPEAVELIHAHAGGVPRTINLLCDAALVYGFADEAEHIDAAIVEQVIADRQDGSEGVEGAPALQASPEEDVNTRDATRIMDRIAGLESRVGKLAVMVEWQEREIAEHLDLSRNQLVLKLEEQIEQERRRADGFLKRCGAYREEVRRLTSKLNSCECDDLPDTGAKTSRPQEQPRKKAGLFRWKKNH